MRCLTTFDTTHAALKFEKICRKSGLNVRVVPVPRELSSSCGFACEYPCDRDDAVRKIARENSLEVVGYHRQN